MQRLFENAGTALTVSTQFVYTTTEDGAITACSRDVNSPVKKAKDFEALYNQLEASLEAFRPKDKLNKLELAVSLQGKVHHAPVNLVFNDMSAYRKFLVDNNLVTENMLTLTK